MELRVFLLCNFLCLFGVVIGFILSRWIHRSDYTDVIESELNHWINSQPSVISKKDMHDLAVLLNKEINGL